MAYYIGFDTSNYTTSVALYDTDTSQILHRKKLLPVKPGERGIRQSDAVFHHTAQLHILVSELLETAINEWNLKDLSELSAIGVSARPRSVSGSYMPCFTVGLGTARTLATVLGIPCYEFSHQDGHVVSALFSADKLSLLEDTFLAFHVSGGTTESLVVKPGVHGETIDVALIGTSSDLKAGQAVDRVGVMLGLDFPCGPELEKLAIQSTMDFKITPSISGFNCSLSGVENKCKAMFDKGEKSCDIALFCIKYIETALLGMTNSLREAYPDLHILFSGGVMSNSIIRESFKNKFNCSFATPEFSSDNAAGIAILASLKDNMS